MGYDDYELSNIYDKTGGYCRYCGKRLYWRNYARIDKRGAWEADHGIPLSRGGSDYFRNLWPSCIECNREKGDMTTREYRGFMEWQYNW